MALAKQEMLDLLADNTTGDISAQDMRDIIGSLLSVLEDGVDINNALDFLAEKKANRLEVINAIVNTYTGTTLPSNTLGKSGDLYHKYSASSSTVLESGLCKFAANTDTFLIFEDGNTNGLGYIAIEKVKRKVFIGFGSDGSPHLDDVILKIGGTDIPLTVIYQSNSDIDFNYDSSFDGLIAGITTSTTFELKSQLLQGKEEDYTNFSGVWYLTPIFNETYDFIKVIDKVISSVNYTPVANLIVPQRDGGVYEVKFSVTFTYDSTNKSASFRWDLNGAGFEEFSIEPKDKTDIKALTYIFPYTFTGGAVDIKLEAKCEGASDILDIKFANIIMERKA